MSLFGSKARKDEDEFVARVAGRDALTRPPTGAASEAPRRTAPVPEPSGGEAMANIGKSISIKGDVTGNEDLVIEGRVEGKIDLPDNELTIGSNGNVSADVHAKSVVVIGKVGGNVTAAEKVEIQSSGSVEGDVRAPRLIVQEGAVLNGSVEMSKAAGKPATAAPPLARTGTAATP